MKVVRFFSILMITLYLSSCAILTKAKDDAVTAVVPSLDFPNLSTNIASNATSTLSTLTTPVLDSMVNRFFEDNKTNPEITPIMDSLADDSEGKRKVFENYYMTYADSLKQKLIDSGSINIKSYESFLIDYFIPKKNTDTVYLANLFSATEKKGKTISYQYQVIKGDQIFFEFENKKGKIIQEITFIEGAEKRFSYANLSKNEKTISGSFVVQSDNTLTLNIIKNGFFKSLIRIKIVKVPKTQEISFKTIDSIPMNKTVVEEVADTVYTVLEDQNFNLSPILDLTSQSSVDFPILIDGFENIIGWGYWIGLDKKDTSKFIKLSETDPSGNPLISFAKAELTKTRPISYLPITTNENINFRFRSLQKEDKSLNSYGNFAFFFSKKNPESSVGDKKAQVYLTNNSKLYEYPILVKTIAVNLEYSKIEIEKVVYTKVKYINIKLGRDE